MLWCDILWWSWWCHKLQLLRSLPDWQSNCPSYFASASINLTNTYTQQWFLFCHYQTFLHVTIKFNSWNFAVSISTWSWQTHTHHTYTHLILNPAIRRETFNVESWHTLQFLISLKFECFLSYSQHLLILETFAF